MRRPTLSELISSFALTALLATASASPLVAQPFVGCPSNEIFARFDDFSRTGKMPPDLGDWLREAKLQYVEPWKPFDNVYFVGVCWVSAWAIRTSDGVVLIDTLHEPHVDQLVENLRKAGVDLPQEIVVKDGDVIRLGGNTFGVLETPGHTLGTASYTFDVKDGASTHHAITVGGLGLNAIKNSKQVEGYIASVDRITALVKRTDQPVTVHLTTHPFSTGLTEARHKLAARNPGEPNPVVDPTGFLKQLATLHDGAEQRLEIERKAGR